MASATRCARVIVAELVEAGVRDAVLSPGSRSAPLAYELCEADRIGLLRLHVRLDERGAGFLALGLAKATGLPVPVVTTSGTAAANLLPAVLEAWHSAIPLLAVTADRPRETTFTGANQTTDQSRLFGDHVRASVLLSDAGDDAWWQFELARLLAAATGSRSQQPGPVHVDVAFTPPLVPDDAPPPSTRALLVSPRPRQPEPTPLDGGPQTVVVVGDLPPERGRAVAAQVEAAGIPLLAEPSSNARRGRTAVGTYRLALGSSLAEDVERVVVFGRPTVSRPVQQLIARRDVELVVVAEHAEWLDPGTNAHLVCDDVDLEPGDPTWLRRWTDADTFLRAETDAILAELPYLSGPTLAATLWSVLGSADTLVSGSSSPLRDLDLAPISAEPPAVFANRGLSGIDGTTSTAVGVALAVERPVHALMGDTTFLHDLNGLVLGPLEPRPDLRIVVADDDGGSIFATLEHGHPSFSGSFERIFGAPHGIDLAAAALGLGATVHRARDADDLGALLAEPPLGLELVVVKVDRAQRRTLHRRLTGLAATL